MEAETAYHMEVPRPFMVVPRLLDADGSRDRLTLGTSAFICHVPRPLGADGSRD